MLPPERSALAVRAAQALLARGGEDHESAAADLWRLPATATQRRRFGFGRSDAT